MSGSWSCAPPRNLTWINEAEMLLGQLYSLFWPQSVITVEEVQFTLLTQEQDLYMGDMGASVGSSWASPDSLQMDFRIVNQGRLRVRVERKYSRRLARNSGSNAWVCHGV
ncbi:MAG: hypothetical protein R3F19_32520 [Verrucomicrobiales bacterium]